MQCDGRTGPESPEGDSLVKTSSLSSAVFTSSVDFSSPVLRTQCTNTNNTNNTKNTNNINNTNNTNNTTNTNNNNHVDSPAPAPRPSPACRAGRPPRHLHCIIL